MQRCKGVSAMIGQAEALFDLFPPLISVFSQQSCCLVLFSDSAWPQGWRSSCNRRASFLANLQMCAQGGR